MIYAMLQACREVGMTYEALKFYCNKGLVPGVKRDKNGRRIFDERDVAWIKSLTCLKNCGLSIEEMHHYLDLCLQGPASIPERQQLLAEKRDALLARIEELHGAMDYIDTKQQFYQDVLDGVRPYVSNLLPADDADAQGVPLTASC